MSTAFGLLHPSVQRKLWDMRWTELRPIQDAAIRHLLGPDAGDTVIASPTASGKTEAAFLPVLSSLADDFSGGARAMYIGPLKALINDQFRRVEELCERMSTPVCKWHGDVNDSAKKRFLSQPAGVLLITPESLEAMLIRRPTEVPRLFSALDFVVIDEMHAFMGTERGAHLVSLLHRLTRRARCAPIRIGLSATFGDPNAALEWLRPGGTPARLIQDGSSGASLQLRVRGFMPSPPVADAEADPTLRELARAIIVATSGRTNLVFSNAKKDIELLADALAAEASRAGLQDEIVVHHGSLSKERRHHAEERLREAKACTAVCSNTLELGIDIGEIDEVVQVSAPWSTASLVQRVGRSGRRPGSPRVLRGFFVANEVSEHSTCWDRLQLPFLQGLATIELMLERFIEPPRVGRAHLSTLIHQTLAFLAETGGALASEVYATIARSGAFGRVSSSDFAAMLRQLGQRQFIEQMADGNLIVGITGEKLVGHYSFYAAFNAPEEMRVVHGADEIGRVALPPPPGDHIVLAGRRWQVEAIDCDRKEVVVKPARGARAPRFNVTSGIIHPAVHEKMMALLVSDLQPAYVDAVGLEILASARREAASLARFAPRLQAIQGGVRVFTFAGSRVQQTLFIAFERAGLRPEDRLVGFELQAPAADIARTLDDLANSRDARELARYADEVLVRRAMSQEKFEYAADPDVWQAAYAREELDVEGAATMAVGLRGGLPEAPAPDPALRRGPYR